MFSYNCKYLFWIVCACFLVHCGGLSSTLTGSSSDTTGATADPVGGNVSQVEFLEGSSSVAFESMADDDEVVMMLYSYNEEDSAAGFQMGASESSAYLSASLYEEAVTSSDADETELFHYQLRNWEEELDPSAIIESGNSSYLASSYLTGSQRTFKVLNSFSSSSSYDTVDATLQYETDDFNFYVDNRNLDSLDDVDLEELANTFTGVIDDERSMIGSESDIDGNGKFNVLFTQTVNGLSGSSGGMVTGFFYAVDLLSSDIYDISNESEVYYTFVPDPAGDLGTAITKSFATTNIYPGVMVHELQHMINFNQHYFLNDVAAERGWLNEGLSHLMEDIYSLNSSGYMAETGLENPARVKNFIENIQNLCLTCGTSLGQRGGAYLFTRYLYEQAELGNLPNVSSGEELIGNLVQTSLRDIENVVDVAYGIDGTTDDFKNVFGTFALAVYLSNTGLNDDNRLNFLGIDLRAEQDDNRSTVLDGPSVQTLTSLPFTDTLSGNSISYLQITGETIHANGGTLGVEVSSDAKFGAYVIY